MSLRWFAFDADAYTGDTAHLTCEEHGAYLLMILAYYRSEKPLPGTDRALAAITKLPMDRWLECKPTLQAFFEHEIEEHEGYSVHRWRHARIEREIADGYQKTEKKTARASAGGTARWEKARAKGKSVLADAPSTLEAVIEDAPRMLGESTLTLTLTKDSLSTRANEVLKEEVPSEPPPEPEQVVSMPISRTFAPTPHILERIMADADVSTIHLEIQKFIFHHLEQGSFSSDWQASFEKWWVRFIEHHKKTAKPRAAPRIEVNTTATEIDWERHLGRWLKNNSLWSHKLCGPEPGQSGCRVPLAELQKLNIDPVTGIKIREAG